MEYIAQSDTIQIRYTKSEDLDFVIKAENDPENTPYVGQWSREQHLGSLEDNDIVHLIVEEISSRSPVGYIILMGRKDPNQCINLKRIVIVDKGKGLGREALKLTKKITFEQLKSHRLWLDVRLKNYRAQHLYKSEGFTEEGIQRECIKNKNSYDSLIILSILENEYNKKEDRM